MVPKNGGHLRSVCHTIPHELTLATGSRVVNWDVQFSNGMALSDLHGLMLDEFQNKRI